MPEKPDKLPTLEELPPFEEAAKEAMRKAREAGGGKYQPGNVKANAQQLDDAVNPEKAQARIDRERKAPPQAAPAGAPAGQLQDQKGVPIPPVVRSALTFSGQCVMITSRALDRAIIGSMGGLLYQGRSFSYAAGYRDGSRGFDPEDKGNHFKLRDPVGLHRLTVPITGILAWKLHKDEKFDLFKPMTEYVPELPRAFDAITPRDILAMRVSIDDEAVFKSVGATVPFWLDRKRNVKWHKQVWKPVGEAFKASTPAESRTALLSHLVKKADSLPRMRRYPALKGQLSHCGVALLALAMERTVGRHYEDLMEANVFHALETPSAGFGAPRIINRSHIFYQPGGLPAGHWDMTQVVKPEDEENAAPPVFNASLNAFANPEEFAKLATCFFEGAVNATKEFAAPSNLEPYWELGVRYEPSNKYFSVRQNPMSEVPTPWAAAANYDLEKDVGAFILTNSGSRRARLTANFAAFTTTKLFIKQVVDAGVNVWEDIEGAPDVTYQSGERGAHQVRVNNANQEKMGNLFQKDSYSKWVGGMDKHTRL
uniref:Beta-lactamase-related domain-containing protein n=1 Tax=Neobodo designis TaxID=312471 RepID=A0A7S1MIV2_NEODS|mmetsp:Transcript_41383/g.127929  ORF Transcript_41383/g.127929 Transcript_41383/m.127929 type:complete len:540 (+) Transcript_41383:64-1683(+)